MGASTTIRRALRQRCRQYLGCLAVASVAACSDSTSPTEAFDPLAADQTAGGLITAVDSNPAIQSLGLLGSFSLPQATAMAQATVPFTPTAPWIQAGWGQTRLKLLRTAALAAEPAIIFPANLLGKTFVYNPTTQQYEADDTLAGAPSNGVRFLLYGLNPVTGAPLDVNNPVGYVDLTDESTAAANVLRVVAVINDVTYLDYAASATVTTSSLTFSAVGFVSDGTQQVNFDLLQQIGFDLGQQPPVVTSAQISYNLQVAGGGAGVSLDIVLDPDAESMNVTLSITDGTDTVRIVATSSETNISGTISFNGVAVVQFSGDPDNPTFTDMSGNALSGEDLKALREIVDAAEEAFDAFDNLLVPAYLAFGIDLFFDF